MKLTDTAVTLPVRPAWGSPSGITPSRTVAICGPSQELTMVAMMLPPNAGRICISRFFRDFFATRSSKSSISRAVQSAVRPVIRVEATRGARERPMWVAPNSTM